MSDVEKLIDELNQAISDYRRIWPEPNLLSPNLALARGLADALDALAAEKLKAEWIASQAVIHRSEGDNRERNMREERDNLISVLNDKDDAPLWRRIARQRLELARLSRTQFQHSSEIHQLRRWFRERIAADGGQARKELRELQAQLGTILTTKSRGA